MTVPGFGTEEVLTFPTPSLNTKEYSGPTPGEREHGVDERKSKSNCAFVKPPRLIGYPQLKPHDLRHGVAMEVYEQHGDLEQVRGLLGHARIDTTQVYAQVRPARLKQAVGFYEGKALEALTK